MLDVFDMLKTTLNSEVLVIGAGIAGCSVAYELARRGVKVCIAEREASPGYHTTGRSAATFVGCYGNNLIRAISAASLFFFRILRKIFVINHCYQIAVLFILLEKIN